MPEFRIFPDRAHVIDTVQNSSIQDKSIPKQDAVEVGAVLSFPRGSTVFRDDIAGAVEQHGAAALWPIDSSPPSSAIFSTRTDRFALETGSPAQSIEHDDQKTEFPYSVTTPRGIIRADKMVHCTNGFAASLIPNLIGRLYP
ncbi:hypothetical protein TPAR_06718 [Tolypocladium paradoxum]|uniref:FAD dependent oxidoreductase domain-containing protein n=1 Tax=Tolypocladium paradoxum TaxID=94208 RepID=A0A2S4KSC4_9HYPO|nr:hypothetical protein TPAR_06718 [Tolypocladium paradoxum]